MTGERTNESAKRHVRDFWEARSCGEELYLRGSDVESYDAQARERYRLEPFVEPFAGFREARGKRVLEIGVGLGADHQRFAEAGADLYGVDLTERAVIHTRQRLAQRGLASQLSVGDAEHLEFPDGFFDYVYSWGVLHHSPDTPRAVREVWRVLKDGGDSRIMIYHKWSMVGLMLWTRYALLRLRPWTPLREIYSRYLESPGTKAYTVSEAARMFSVFREVRIRTVLTHADLLESEAAQRHRGTLLEAARRVWPRTLLRRMFPRLGLFMLVEARK